jgi:hypothetical protein
VICATASSEFDFAASRKTPSRRFAISTVCPVADNLCLCLGALDFVFNEVRAGTLARIPHVRTHERQPIGRIRISDHTDLSRKLTELLRSNYESVAAK